jgi:hypothetical protein
MPKPKELARRLKKVAGKKRLPGQKVTLKQQGSPKSSKQADANSAATTVHHTRQLIPVVGWSRAAILTRGAAPAKRAKLPLPSSL